MMKTKFPIIMIFLLSFMFGCMSTSWRGNAIRDRISDTPGLGTHDISIDEREGGEIVLRGTVSSERDRQTIESITNKTRGVKEVSNELVVVPSSVVVREGGGRYSTEASTKASEIMAKLAASPEIQNYNLNVDVINDTAVLQGQVGSERERAAAERIALSTRGITGVRNDIVLAWPSARRSDLQITQDVRQVLLRSKAVNLENVEITTRDGIVTFRGSQNSHRDIDRILSIAQSVDGVREVRSQLEVNGHYSNNRYDG